MSQVCAPFASVLQQARDEFNHRFTLARRTNPQLDAEAFTSFLLKAVDPLVALIASTRPEAVFDTVSAAYDTALELATHGLLGPRYEVIRDGWQQILPAAAHLVAQSPNRLLAAVSNALHHLITTEGARPGDWIAALTRLAPLCPDVETFLRVGQLAAWRAGLAHFRISALEMAASLPAPLVGGALGSANDEAGQAMREAFLKNPWHSPAASSSPGLRLVRSVGAFRGFGGLFSEPPRVAVQDGQLLAASGSGCWLLSADSFGATFHRVTASEWGAAKEGALPRGVKLSGGTLSRGSESLSLVEYGPITSKAATDTTLAITTAHTHAVLLVALT